MKVLVVGPTPPPLQGMSVFTEMLVRPGALDRSCRVVHLDTADRRTVENMGRLDPTNVGLAVLHAWRLLALIVRERPAVVYIGIAQNRLAYLRDALLMAIARATGRAIVTHLHGSAFREFHDSSGRLMRWLIRRTLGWSRDVVVLSERLVGLFDGLVPRHRVRVVAAGVPDPFPDGTPPVRTGDGVTTVGYLGLLYEAKGFVTLLEAAAELNATAPGQYRFRFAGDWFSRVERRAAERWLAEGGLGEVVEFLDPVVGAGKRAFLESLDILVFPGRQREGLPLVVLEGMAAGRAVVATEVGSIADAIRPGLTGRLVPPGAVGALVEAIRDLAVDPVARARMGRAARRLYLEQYTDERCIERMVRLLTAGPAAVRGVEGVGARGRPREQAS